MSVVAVRTRPCCAADALERFAIMAGVTAWEVLGLTVREAGDLADQHGFTLEDFLPV